MINSTASHNKTEQDPQTTSAVSKAALALNHDLDVTVTLETLLDWLEQLIPYDSASIMLLDDEGFLVIQATRGYEQWLQNAGELKGTALPVSKVSLPIHNIYLTRQSRLIPDVQHEPGWQPEIGAGAVIHNWMGVPLIAGGRFIGLISLDKMEPDIFTETHVQLAEELAPHAALAIQNAQQFHAKQVHSQKLQQSQAILFQAEKAGALGRLTTTIAHEINNPIQAIQGCLTLVREELDGRNNKELIDRYLDIIEIEARRITNIINRIRSAHLTDVGTSRRPCDVNTLLDNVLHQNEKQFDNKQITLQRKWARNLPLINANKDNLEQAFQNIILNAIEVLNPNQRLALETRLCQKPSNDSEQAIRITIHNSGRPIPEHIQQHLFEPYISTKELQFGLGLFVTHSIIEAHGGQITATSTAEQGTTFTIHLPVPSHPPPQSTTK